MKVGFIVKPNQKGQIVIPKEIRESLGISSDLPLNLIMSGDGFYIYPVKEVLSAAENGDAYIQILKKTKGTWNHSSEKLGTKKKKIELSASKTRKKPGNFGYECYY